MKNKIIAMVIALSLIPIYPVSADQVGNGTDPVIGLSEEQKATLQETYNLDYLKLTPEEIIVRDKKLEPVYRNYQSATVGKVVNALESVYGINVYHQIEGQELDFSRDKQPTKKELMAAAVRAYVYCGYQGCDQNEASPFHNASATEFGYMGAVGLSAPNVSADLVKGPKKRFSGSYSFESRYAVFSEFLTDYDDVLLGLVENNRTALYSTMSNNLFSHPGIIRFLDALKVLNLKALDATVVFTAGEIQVDDSKRQYFVRYPTYSRLAPVPQPVIFIRDNASEEEIIEMLQEHSPQIYAYNKLFDLQVLPTVAELERALDRFPQLTQDVIKLKGQVSRQNLQAALQAAFLSVTYTAVGVVTAPLTLTAMLLSPLYYPVILAKVVILL